MAYGATGEGLFSFPEGVTKTFFGAGVPDWTVDPSATDVVVPDGVPMIPFGAFCGCSLLTSFVASDSVTAIGNEAFYMCSSLTSFVGSDSVTAIGDYAFYGCSLLTSFVGSDSVKTIGDVAFYGCTSLTTASIPAGATLGYGVFKKSPTTVTTRD